MKKLLASAFALMLASGAAQAATYTYDFKAEANASGQIGEAIFSTFQTNGNGVFTGPNLEVTATKNGNAAFVYFDNGNAGMGVCGVPNNAGQVNQYASGSGSNRCNPSSDDGITNSEIIAGVPTPTVEALHFKATEKALKITSFLINSNHDGGLASVLGTVWEIGGVSYSGSDLVNVGAGGDVRIDVNYTLAFGESLSIFGVSGANSYISAIGVSAVPLPAAGMMLLAGLGGFGALRMRKKK